MPPSESELLAECVANPDDDAPRLVWADAVGGERGELVVLQCDLARGDRSPEKLQRERELLDAHGIEWAGRLPAMATRWSFRRGFIETARFQPVSFDEAKLVDTPLLASIVVDTWPGALAAIEQAARAFRPLRGLALQGWFANEHDAKLLAQLADSPALHGLRALQIEGPILRAYDAVRSLVARAPIETLCLRDHRLHGRMLDELFAAAPRLSAIAIEPLVHVPPQPLRALRTDRVDLAALAKTSAQTLEHLACEIGDQDTSAFTRLRTLITTRRVNPPWEDELLHHDPAAMFTLGVPCFAKSQPACIVQLVPGGVIWDLTAMPAEERVLMGRGQDCIVRLMTPMLSRRHAALTWRDGRHELHDLGSENGTYVNDQMIQSVELTDGFAFSLSDVPMQYFVGPGARERAEAARRGA